MKKAFLLFVVLVSVGLMMATQLSPLNLDFAPITPALMKEVAQRNSMIRGYSWAPGTPTLLPNATGMDESNLGAETYLDYDFAPYISVDGGTDLNSLIIGWSQSSNIEVTRPDAAQPYVLRFTPKIRWFGDAPVWVSIFQVVDGIYTNPVSIGITIRVKNAPTPPTFSFPSITDPSPVNSGYVYEKIEGFEPWTVDFSNIVEYFDGNGFNLFLYPTEYPEPILAEQRNTPGGPIVNGGKIVTFRLNPDHPRYPYYYGTYRFGSTAVDNHPSAAFKSTTFDIYVENINDAPEITAYTPASTIALDQNDTQVFTVTAIDVDLEPISYEWVYAYTLNGVDYVDIMQTTGPTLAGNDTFTHLFNIPGHHTVTITVTDADGLSDSHTWQIEVHPEGPQFDPEGLVTHPFSQSVTNLSFGTEGLVISAPGIDQTGLVIYYTSSSTNPLVPDYSTPQVYTGPIPIPIPPRDYTYTVTAWYTHPDFPESQHVTRIYRMTGKVSPPVFVETTGIIRSNDPFAVHISGEAGLYDDIYYSYDGGPWTLYTGEILIPAHTVATLRAYAVKDGWEDSDPSAEYVYDVRRFVEFAAPSLIADPVMDPDGSYCVCIYESVHVNFAPVVTNPAAAKVYYQIQTGINTGSGAIDPYAYDPAAIQLYDPLNPPTLEIFHTSTILWWAEYTDTNPDYLISDIHRYPMPVKNRTKMSFWGSGNDSVFNPPAGTYTTPVDVLINTTTVPANATIWYTIDGGAPQPYLGGTIHVEESTVLMAYADPMPPLTTMESLHWTAAYNITGTLPIPLIAPPGFPTVQMYENDILVTLSMPADDPAWAGATIRYTINGIDPTASSPAYTAPLPLAQGIWQIRARAFLTDWVESGVAYTEYYVKTLPVVTFGILETTHYNDINVDMHAYGSAEIRYTLNGDDPTPGSPLYSTPIPLAIDPAGPFTRTFRASAFLAGWVTSLPAEISYTMIPTVANPNISPVATQHDMPITVTIDSATPGAAIWYTLDSSEPGPGNPNSILYTDPGFVLDTTKTVRAIAVKTGFRSSEIVRRDYVIGSNISPLIFTPPAGDYTSAQNVTIIASPPNAEIWYTTDGSDPVAGTNGTLFNDPISLLTNTQTLIKAVAVLPHWQPRYGQALYNITGKLASPMFTPPGGQYTMGSTVDVSITAPNGDISYSINSGPFVVAASPVELTVTANTSIVAKAVLADWVDSDPAIATYIFNSALNPPLISPVSGTYHDPIQVVIYSTNPSSEIYYTLDPDPLVVPNILYTQGTTGFTLNQSGVVRAISKKTNWLDSIVTQNNYIMRAPAPTFTPPAGTYAQALDIAIGTPGEFDIWYTLDGSVPAPANPSAMLYTTPLTVSSYTRIRAMAMRTGWENSDVVEAIYTINGKLSNPIFSLAAGTYMTPQTLSITANPAGAQIYYWLNGSIADSTLYTAPIQITENTVVRARSYLANWLRSDNVEADYFLKVQALAGTPPPSVYYTITNVSLDTATPDVSIYYTTDGSMPSQTSTPYTVPIVVTETQRIRAIAYKNVLDWLPSDLFDQHYVINQQVAAPEFSPNGGVFSSDPVIVEITTTTADATIWYSIGGGSWTEYTVPLELHEGSSVVRAYASKANWTDSQIVTQNYIVIIPTVDLVRFDPVGGIYNNPLSVSLYTSTAGAQIYYALGTGTPDLLYNGAPIAIGATETIRAKAVLSGYHDSEITEATYTISPLMVLSPVLTPEAGTYSDPVTVRMYSRTPGSTILYKLGEAAPELEYDPLNPPVVTQTTLVKAKAVKADMDDSEEVSALYTITGSVELPALVFDPAPGIYNAAVQVTLNQSMVPADASLYYTINGSNPVNTVSATNFVYTGPFMISPVDNPNVTVKVRAFKNQWQPSDIASAIYTFQAAAPVFDPASGNFTDAIAVSIESSTPGASIHYTTDGSNPSSTDGILYTGAINIPADSNYFIKAVAYRENWLPSTIVAANYNVTGTVQAVMFNPPGGTYTEAKTVVLSTLTEGATIRYTINGDEPTAASTIYTMPIAVPLNTPNFTIKAKAFRTGWQSSVTGTEIYTITGQVAFNQPVFSPAGGTYGNPIQVTIAAPIPADATVYYTTDGSIPSALNGNEYSGAINVNQTLILKAVAVKNAWTPSGVQTAEYEFQAAPPAFTPPGGWYENAQNVVLSTATTGASIRYTTDGTIPTASNGVVYTNPIPVSVNQDIKAYTLKAGYLDSEVISQTYAIGSYVPVVATPEFSVIGGTYPTSQSVAITVSTPGATIRYTTDGSDPSDTQGTVYTGTAITVPLNTTMTIKAIAYKAEWQNSQISISTYIITGTVASVVFTPAAGTYTAAQNVVLTSATEGAYFRYTTDGTEPNISSSLYTTAINVPLNSSLTIKAKAYKTDWTPSATGTATYTITGQVIIPEPVFSLAPGTYATAQTVSVGNPIPADAVLRYTLDGSEPSSSSLVMPASLNLPLATVTTLNVKAFKADWISSPVYTAVYTVTGQVALPVNMFDPPSGTYPNSQLVNLIGNTVPDGAVLRYTLNGGEPNELSPAYSTGTGILVNSTSELRVKGFLAGWIPSETSIATYTITGQVVMGTINPVQSTYANAVTINIGSPVPADATIYYTTDGSEPSTSSHLYNGDFVIDALINPMITVKAKAFKTDWLPSLTETSSYTFQAEAPFFNPPSGSYVSTQEVVLTSGTSGAAIYYTTDGSEPTQSSPLYNGMITVSENSTIRARAFKDPYLPSPIMVATYGIGTNLQVVALPAFSVASGTYQTQQSIALSTTTPNATIYYTTDGTDPSTASAEFDPAHPIIVPLHTSVTIKAMADRAGWISSQIATATYTVTGQVEAVAFTPAAGTYTSAQAVALSSTTPGAYFRYTTDGSEPNASSALYNAPILITQNTTLKAKAYLADWVTSETSTAVYVIYGSTSFNQPLFTPQPGNYNGPQMVTIADPIPAGAAVYYTLDGSVPTPGTGILYTGPFMIDGNATLSAIAWVDGWDSPVYSGSYAFLTAEPGFNPIPGYYADPITVLITSATPGATIYYTTDGTEPTLASNVYSAGIAISGSTLFKAMAVKNGYANSSVVIGNYGIGGVVTPTVASPVFDPLSGTYTTGQMVQISSSTPGAIIRYTTDGSIPSETTGLVYAGPIELQTNSYTVIRAIAYMTSGYYPSPVVSSTYNITGKVSAVVFTPPAGTYQSAQLVQLTSTTPGAYIRYTLNGTEPTSASTLYTGSIPVALNINMTIKAKAFKDGWEDSDTGTAIYNTTGVISFNQPVFSPAPGAFSSPISVEIAAPIPATAMVYYSLDGSDPTIPYTGAISINANSVLRAKAVLNNWATGEASGSYTFRVAPPVFTPPAGYYDTAQVVELNSSTPGATIVYTTDGSIPSATNGTAYTAPISVDVNQIIRAYAYLAGYNDSPLVSAAYTIGLFIPVVANPIFSPGSTNSYNEIVVSISTITPGAHIRYTTDGSDPSPEYGTLYTGPITVPQNTNVFIKAIAYREGWSSSAIVAGSYTVTGTVQAVMFNPPGGTYTEAKTVVLSTLTEGATIRYTINGDEPTAASTIYTMPIAVPLNTPNFTIKAKAFRTGWQSSVTGTEIYTITGQVAFNQPVFSPAGGTYGNPIQVTIAAPIPADATVYYTTDGSIPSALNGNEYSGAINVNQTLILKAVAVKNAWTPSGVQTAEYEFQAAPPAFTPPGGWYENAQNVVLSTATTGASIRYTTDGTIPTASNGVVYTNPIPVSVNQDIKAYTLKAGYLDSEVISQTYAIGSYVPVVATPEFSVIGGTYPTSQSVAITVSTPGATIRYTTDGSDPSDTQGTVYTGTAITVPLNTTMTIKAIAYKAEWQNSQISISTYIITGTVASVVFTPAAGTYTAAQNVVLTSATEGAYFRYTTDGTEPNISSSLYTTAINVPLNSSLTIKAKAYKTDWTPSATGTATYTITGQVIIPEPVFSLAPGTYATAQTVSVGNPIPADAVLRYTLDGSEPSSSSLVMPASLNLPLATVTTLNVKAFKADWISSPVYTAVYNVTGKVALPVNMFDPPSGTYQNAQLVHLMGNTVPAGAILRYTLNGGEPNELSPAYSPETGIIVNSTSELRVKGFLAGWIPSETSIATYTITGQVLISQPVFNPAAGTYTSAQAITIGNVTPSGAVIRYTTNGSEPLASSPVFPQPLTLPLDSTTTLKVKAFYDDWTPSATHTAVYKITGQVSMTAPVFSPAPDAYTDPISITINQLTYPAAAQIRYTMDGSDPNGGSALYTEPIPIGANQAVTIRTRAFVDEWIPSVIHTATYNVTGQAEIVGTVFAPDPAVIYTTVQTVVINTTTNPSGAAIHFTTDGTEPGASSPVYAGQPIQLGLGTITTVKAKVIAAGWTSSPTYTAIYTVTGQVSLSAVSLMPAPGVYQTAQAVSVSGLPVPNDAVLRYTTDGTDPVEASPIFTGLNPALNSTLNLKIRGFKPDWIPSPVLTGNYQFTGQIALPAALFTPVAGTYATAQTIYLSIATTPTGTTLRYTINGDDPTEDSPAYSQLTGIPLPLYSGVSVIKVQAYKQDWTPSAVASATYNITGGLVFNTPIFTPAAGTYASAQTIEINGVNTTGAQIRYTTDGSDPTQTSTLYTGPFALTQINTVHTVKARAFKTDWTPSAIATAVYNITGQAAIDGVVFDPAPNPAPAAAYTTAQIVSISTATTPSGAVVHYTTDGSIPTASSPVYTSPISVGLNTTMTIRARAFADNWNASEVYSGVYRVTGTVVFNAANIFSPAPGTYNSAQVISVSGNTTPAGAAVHFTTDGSEPTLDSPLYAAGIPLPLDSTTTIKIKGFAEGWIPSQTYEATYIITGKVSFSGELFTPPAGTYTSAQDVEITAAVYPASATIYYTTDGSEPDQNSTVYSGAIDIPLNTPYLMIQARAFAENWVPSEIIRAAYKITGQVILATDLLSPAAGIYTTAQMITVAAPVLPDNAVIRYTTNGEEPTAQSPAYTTPISIPLATQLTLKFKGFAEDWIPSATTTAVYSITGQVAEPIFNYPSGMYNNELHVEITTTTPEAEIRYTTNGDEPTATSELYSAPVTVPVLANAMQIKAKAFKTDWITSPEASAVYSVITLPYNVRSVMYEGYVRILWNSDLQIRGLDGFYVYRSQGNNPGVRLNPTPTLQTTGPDYYWDDYSVSNFTTYQYWVTAVYDGVESNVSSMVSVEFQAQVLAISSASRVYPNPAEHSTTIQIRLTRNDNVQISVSIYDFAGKKVRTLNSSNLSTNFVEIPWDLKNDSGTKLARGTYFARIVAKDSANTTEKVLKISVK